MAAFGPIRLRAGSVALFRSGRVRPSGGSDRGCSGVAMGPVVHGRSAVGTCGWGHLASSPFLELRVLGSIPAAFESQVGRCFQCQPNHSGAFRVTSPLSADPRDCRIMAAMNINRTAQRACRIVWKAPCNLSAKIDAQASIRTSRRPPMQFLVRHFSMPIGKVCALIVENCKLLRAQWY